MHGRVRRFGTALLITVVTVFVAVACTPPPPSGGGGSGGNNDTTQNNDDNDFELVEGRACIHVSPETIDFGPTPLDELSSVTLNISNCSVDEELVIDPIDLVQPGSAFQLDPDGQGPAIMEGGLVLAAEQSESLFVEFTPDEERSFEGSIEISHNDDERDDLLIQLEGEGTDELDCPTAEATASIDGSSPSSSVQAAPGDVVELSGEESEATDGGELAYEWAVIDLPDDSLAQLDFPDTDSQPQLEVDLVGAYVVELAVVDDNGVESCEPAIVNIDVVSDSDGEIFLELTWINDEVEDAGGPDPTAQIGTDLGIHYKMETGSWGDENSVYWQYVDQDWDDHGTAVMDIDSLYGDQPETVLHENPASGGTYSVGVHYYCDNGYDESDATMRVYFNDQLATEETREITDTGDFWHVGDLSWSSDPSFDLVDSYTENFPDLPSCNDAGDWD